MTTPPRPQITQLLRAWSGGDQRALEQLTPLVYARLHRTARRYMAGERPAHTLQATALINEVYLRLVDSPEISWHDRAHFFAVCARLMRRILTDFAHAEAEPLLLESYQGMAVRKDRMGVPDWYHLDHARESIVQLYETWGKPAKAAEWRKKIRFTSRL